MLENGAVCSRSISRQRHKPHLFLLLFLFAYFVVLFRFFFFVIHVIATKSQMSVYDDRCLLPLPSGDHHRINTQTHTHKFVRSAQYSPEREDFACCKMLSPSLLPNVRSALPHLFVFFYIYFFRLKTETTAKRT